MAPRGRIVAGRELPALPTEREDLCSRTRQPLSPAALEALAVGAWRERCGRWIRRNFGL